MSWNKEDLSNYNKASPPWFHTYINGKVDIGNKIGDSEKISLHPWGMYKLVEEWLKNGSGLNPEQKSNLIKLLK